MTAKRKIAALALMAALLAGTICIQGLVMAASSSPLEPPDVGPKKPAPLPAPVLTLKITSLYAAPQGHPEYPAYLVISPDGRHFAAKYGAAIVIDGKEIANYDLMRQPVFSPDSKHCAFAAVAGQKCYIIMDGVEKPLEGPADMLSFSPDSKRLACVMRLNGKYHFVLDGRKGPPYDDVQPLAKQYQAAHGPPVVLQCIYFSPDSQHTAYLARRGTDYCVVRDGKEGKTYKQISVRQTIASPFSPDSKHLVYYVENQGIVIDEVEFDRNISGPVFSPDGAHTAFVDRTVFDKQFVMKDFQVEPTYKEVTTPLFSPDSNRMVYCAKNDKDWLLVVDGVESLVVGAYQVQPHFSPDSRHIAYMVFDGTQHFLALDGDKHAVGNASFGPVFSPDSKRVACVARGQTNSHEGFGGGTDAKGRVYLDFVPGKEYDRIGCLRDDDDRRVVFSPDSRHIAYFGKVAAEYYIVVDATEQVLAITPWTPPIFDSPTHLHFIGLKENKEVILVEVEITE
jgi:Tol biopolymer transport system component